MPSDRIERLRAKATGLPEKPGIYKMLDNDDKVIYVGKAINLKRRVSSYFQRLGSHSSKTAALVSNVEDFDVVLTSNEFEALLLENNLIKEYRPKYNILLKDDKGYPFIKVTVNEKYPRVTLARKRRNDGAKYFGPFGSSRSAKSAIEAASRAFALPTCANPTPREGRRPCLNFRIKRCIGLCKGDITQEDYAEIIKQVLSFFEGNISEVTKKIQKEMERAADNLDFEKAAVLRDRLRGVTALKEKQRVVASSRLSADYIAAALGDKKVCVFILKVRKGILAADRADFYPLSDIQDDFIGEYIKRYYDAFSEDIPGKICTSVPIEDKSAVEMFLGALKGGKVRITSPKQGNDSELIKMAADNAKERLTYHEGRTGKAERVLHELSEITGLKPPLSRIEIYDVSEISGTGMVCGMAVFKDGISDRSSYRKFRIETAGAGDDPAAMSEALRRRLSRYASGDENFSPLPDLIFADGAQSQVNALVRTVNESGYDIPVLGLKKDSRHRTKSIVFPQGHEVLLYKHPEVFALCGRMQEEAHRFAIEYHRKIRSQRNLLSSLTEIEGIGRVRAQALMKHFKTLNAIKTAGRDELLGVKGMNEKLVSNITEYFKREKQTY